jgi:hypothetical protein
MGQEAAMLPVKTHEPYNPHCQSYISMQNGHNKIWKSRNILDVKEVKQHTSCHTKSDHGKYRYPACDKIIHVPYENLVLPYLRWKMIVKQHLVPHV